jgi:c-di-AMP phosphodiesterase-like protein
MPKSKSKNTVSLSGRYGNGLLIGAAAAVLIVLVAVLGTLTDIPLWILGAAALALLLAASVLIFRYADRRGPHGADGQTLSPLLGNIMVETVMHQSAPAFICDIEQERVIWYNRALSDVSPLHTQLYGHPVSDFLSRTLASILSENEGEGAAVRIGESSFRCQPYRFSVKEREFCLLSMTDVTETERLYVQLAQSEAVVAYILIDNLDDMLQYEQEKFRPVAVQIESVLRDWAAQTDGILKEYERDRYLFVFEARHLDDCIVRKFDVLDRIRDIRVGDGKLPVTVSIGVAGIRGDFDEKERAAATALDMALQRGGDQVVVKGENGIEFYGGRSKTVQKRTKVRARVIANELIMHISRASNVIVMGHRYADFDAFGASVGIARLAMFCGAKVNIVTDLQDPNLAGCRALLAGVPDYAGVLVDTRESLALVAANSLLVIVDVNNPAIFENPELAENVDNVVLIDHHRKTAEFAREPLISYIEPSASACCELVAEMLEQALPDGMLLPDEANLMLAGILVDTKQFTKNTGTRTFGAALYLRDRGASPAETQNLFRTDLEDFIREAKFHSNVVIYRGVTAIALGDGDGDAGDRVTAAKAADKLLTVAGVQASFALVRIGDVVHISARSSDTINVQVILEKLRGGGHFDAAGAQVEGTTVQGALLLLKSAIDSYLDGTEMPAPDKAAQ